MGQVAGAPTNRLTYRVPLLYWLINARLSYVVYPWASNVRTSTVLASTSTALYCCTRSVVEEANKKVCHFPWYAPVTLVKSVRRLSSVLNFRLLYFYMPYVVVCQASSVSRLTHSICLRLSPPVFSNLESSISSLSTSSHGSAFHTN